MTQLNEDEHSTPLSFPPSINKGYCLWTPAIAIRPTYVSATFTDVFSVASRTCDNKWTIELHRVELKHMFGELQKRVLMQAQMEEGQNRKREYGLIGYRMEIMERQDRYSK